MANRNQERMNRRGVTPISLGLVLSVCLVWMTGSLVADSDRPGRFKRPLPVRHVGLPMKFGDLPVLQVEAPGSGQAAMGTVAGSCPQVLSKHTASDFEPGAYIAQGGFAEEEIAAVSFTVDPGDFPLRIDVSEMLFATVGTSVQTETQWSVLFWEGFPDNSPDYVYSSDGKLLPHISLPPGNNGVIVQFLIDPGDSDQIILDDDGTHTFSFGFRIDKHNNQTQNPCVIAPPQSSNCFPTVDNDGLQVAQENWLYAVDCGPFGCNAGWSRFSQLGICQPSGDWVMRVSWTPFNCSDSIGSCCFDDGTCADLLENDCAVLDGSFQGDGTTCDDDACPQPTSPCCFESTNGCLDLEPSQCEAAGGVVGEAGVSCDDIVCFPEGACCLGDGTCIGPLSPEECALAMGIFQGDGVDCMAFECPEPVGACCFQSGFCLELTEADCGTAGGLWSLDEPCTANGECPDTGSPADLDGDGLVNGQDLGILLAFWLTADATADINGDGVVDGIDLGILLGEWT